MRIKFERWKKLDNENKNNFQFEIIFSNKKIAIKRTKTKSEGKKKWRDVVKIPSVKKRKTKIKSALNRMESPCARHSGRLALPRRIKKTPRKAIFYCYKLPDALPNYKEDGVAQTKPIMGFKVEHSKIKKKKSQLILKINMILNLIITIILSVLGV